MRAIGLILILVGAILITKGVYTHDGINKHKKEV